MSGRDDIEVIDEAEKSGAFEPQNDTIRQNSPITSEKKQGFFERLKKAFSTEDDSEQPDEGFSGESDNVFGDLVKRFKKPKQDNSNDDTQSVPSQTDDDSAGDNDNTPEIEQTDSTVEAQPPKAEQPIVEEKKPDPAEQEELDMINAFLAGEEYVPQGSAEDEPQQAEFDSNSAFDEEEAVFEELEEEADEVKQSDEEAESSGDTADTQASSDDEAAAEGYSVAENTDDDEKTRDSADKAAEGADDDEGAESAAEPQIEEQLEAESAENGEAAAESQSYGDSEDKHKKALSDEDDEEFVLDEDMLFDEEDEGFENDAEDDELSTIFNDDEENSQEAESVPDTKEYVSEPLDKGAEDNESDIAEGAADEEAESTDNDDNAAEGKKAETAEEAAQNAESSTEKSESEEAANDDVTEQPTGENTEAAAAENTADSADEKFEEKLDSESQESPEKAEDVAEDNTEAKTEENSETAESSNASEQTVNETEEKASDTLKDNSNGNSGDTSADKSVEKNGESGKAGFWSRAKTKLAELWNARSDESGKKEAAEKTDEQSEEALDPLLAEMLSDNKAEETKTEDKVEESAVEDKPVEEAAENKSEETVAEDKPEESATEGKSVEEAAENKTEETATEYKPEEAASEEGSADDTTDDDPVNVISEDRTEQSKTEENTEETTEKNTDDTPDETEKTTRRTPVISVIKNENVTKTDFDEEKLRGSLNVVKTTATDVLTEEQRAELEESKRELERVTEFEAQAKAEREELIRETEQRRARESAEKKNIIAELEVDDYNTLPDEEIKFPMGKFSACVRAEYECTVNYKRMRSISSDDNLLKEIKAEPEKKPDVAESDKDGGKMPEIGESTNPVLKEARDFERNHDKVESIGNKLDYQDERHPEPVEYRTEEDAAEVKKHLASRKKNASLTFWVTLAVTAAAFIFSLFAGKFTVGVGGEAADGLKRGFAALNLLFYAGAAFCCKDMLINGFKPLRQFKANSDTGVALASAAAALQALFAIIVPKPFMSQGLNIYTLVVMLALTFFSAGRYLNADRIAANFRFVSDSEQKYAGKFFTDPRTVAKLLSGTKNDKTEFSFQKKTSFLKHFMKLSNAEDPGDKLASTFSLPTLIASVLVALIAGIMSKSFFDALSVLCIMLCAGIPISSRALGALPLRSLAKKSLLNKSMVVGYSAVDTFSESAAVMIDAKDLYPSGSIQMNRVIRYDNELWQEGVYAAAAVTLAANSAMSGMFDQMLKDEWRNNAPPAEGVMYEDGKGLLGWVNGRRVLVGNRQLLLSHAIPVVSQSEDEAFKAEGDEPLYIAVTDRLVGVITVKYTASHRVSDVLKRMEASDMSLLVRTTDVNITAERISRDFGVSQKSIKVLEQKIFNFIRDEMIGKEKSSPAFIATKGGVTSFGMAVSECVQTKRDISLSTAVEIAGTLVKMLIICVIVLFAGIHQISALQLFIFSLLWAAIVLCGPMVVQRVQGNKK